MAANGYRTLEEAQDATLTRKETRYQIEEVHGLEWHCFIVECGDKPEYEGRQVLDWLGY